MFAGTQELLSLQVAFVLMIICGYILAKLGFIDEKGVDIINDILVYFIVPMNLIKAYLGNADENILRSEPYVFLLAVTVQLIMMLLNKFLYFKFPNKRQRVLQYMTISANSGSLGLSIAEGVFGEIGLIHSSIYTTPNRIFVWTIGITYFTNEKGKKLNYKKILLHPCVIAVFLGLIIFFFQIKLPLFLEKTASYFGACMTPLSMLLIGAALKDVNFKEIVDLQVLYYSILRLFILPAITLVVCLFFPMDNIAKTISVLLCAMPAPIFAVVFAHKYDCDELFASRCVSFTTVLSIVTLPLWLMICSNIFNL